MDTPSAGGNRQFLMAGSGGVGKTALLLTMARGIFPPDLIPRRFEGWTVPVPPTPPGENDKLALTLQRCHSAGNSVSQDTRPDFFIISGTSKYAV